jgi:putative endopeptidase
VQDRLHSLYKDPGEEGTPQRALADWFASCMDLEGIEKQGADPLKPVLARIDAIKV